MKNDRHGPHDPHVVFVLAEIFLILAAHFFFRQHSYFIICALYLMPILII